ncbi:GT2 family glycosyltransferase [Paenibacillus turicensis]|uniref:GT2 family glycosyltransferase n=1 Tax=Paenibacillus turicensis TaxID=160487 RepID=A0ABS4FXG9_9BACL|nr:glycosyltransferase [Paenibacillus turicensis]MBP1907224.1 GT2 family glycosyltransferase [Paenibacillus turicensis]
MDGILIKIKNEIENNNTEAAMVLIKRIEEGYENDPLFWNLKGLLFSKLDEKKLAINCFSKAMILDPKIIMGENKENISKVNIIEKDYSDLHDEDFINSLIDALDLMISIINIYVNEIKENELNEFLTILEKILLSFKLPDQQTGRLKQIVFSRGIPSLIINIEECLENCIRLCNEYDYKNVMGLSEFTLLPMMAELREEIYFFNKVLPYPNNLDLYYKNEFASGNSNVYALRSIKTGKYKYEVSIMVLAYNKLEYTKLCVESILKHTVEIDYELILVNDGSNDATKEYFENISYSNKKVITYNNNNGPMLAFLIGARTAEGRFLATVNNDAIVTKNWLKNLLICLNSDPKNGIVVPITNNISNDQVISVEYETLDEMNEFAEKFNKSNENLWFERERLCPFINVIPMNVYGKGICPDRIYQYAEFSDDDLSLQLRLQGYKLILAKDTFCHHFGSISLGEAQKDSRSLELSRDIFKLKNKIDAWNDLKNNMSDILTNINFSGSGSLKILCVDPGLGMIPYKLRNLLKENSNYSNVELYNFSTNEEFKSISFNLFENFIYSHSDEELLERFSGIQFDFILFCNPFEDYLGGIKILKDIRSLLSNKGELRFMINNPFSASSIINLLSLNNSFFGEKMVKSFISPNYIEELLFVTGFNSIKKIGIISDNNQFALKSINKINLLLNSNKGEENNFFYNSEKILFVAKNDKKNN